MSKASLKITVVDRKIETRLDAFLYPLLHMFGMVFGGVLGVIFALGLISFAASMLGVDTAPHIDPE